MGYDKRAQGGSCRDRRTRQVSDPTSKAVALRKQLCSHGFMRQTKTLRINMQIHHQMQSRMRDTRSAVIQPSDESSCVRTSPSPFVARRRAKKIAVCGNVRWRYLCRWERTWLLRSNRGSTCPPPDRFRRYFIPREIHCRRPDCGP